MKNIFVCILISISLLLFGIGATTHTDSHNYIATPTYESLFPTAYYVNPTSVNNIWPNATRFAEETRISELSVAATEVVRTANKTQTPEVRKINPPTVFSVICNDGEQMYPAHRQGACSHHGGVKEWLK